MRKIIIVCLLLFSLGFISCGEGNEPNEATQQIANLNAKITELTESQVELHNFLESQIQDLQERLETVEGQLAREEKMYDRARSESEKHRISKELYRLTVERSDIEGQIKAYQRISELLKPKEHEA